MSRRAGALALALCCLSPALASAQITPHDATALQQQVQDWLTTTLGPNIKIAKEPVRITPAGDHYAVAVPFGDAPDAPAMTATARPSENGRWILDDVHMTSPAHFHFTPPAALARDRSMVGPVTADVSVGTQSGQILFDPSFTTASTYNSTIGDLDATTAGRQMRQKIHIDREVSSLILQPAVDDRVNVVFDGSIEDYRTRSQLPDQPESVDVAMGKARVFGSADNVSRSRVLQIIHLAAQINAGIQAGATSGPPFDREAGVALLQAIADLASGAALTETVEDLAVSSKGLDGALRAFRLGLTVKGDAGLLQAQLDIGAEGLTLPDLGLGPLVELIPTKVSLRPSVSGLPTDVLMALATKAGDNQEPTPEDIQALFSHGGITAGLDSLSLDVVGTSFTGTGQLVFTSPTEFTGAGQLTATNLELLQQRIAAEPMMAQAVPLLIFIKGIGRVSGNQLVWDILYRNGHAFVNNQDLTALASGRPQPEPPPTRRPQARPPAPPPLLRAHPRQQ